MSIRSFSLNKITIIILVAILLKLFVAATTFHPDLQAFNLSGKVVASGNILGLYDYLFNLEEGHPFKHLTVFNYPPAIYFFHGLFNFIFSDILKLFFINEFILDNAANYGNIFFNLHLLFLKIPYLIFDLLVGFLLFKLFDSKKEATMALVLWLFNPISLYAIYMMGQFDIIPTFFVVLSIYFALKKKLSLAALALGGGIAFKIFPIFFLIPLLILARTNLERVKVIILALLPYLLSILPYLSSPGYKTFALFTSQNSKSLYASIPVSGGEAILLFPLFLFMFYIFLWSKKRFSSDEQSSSTNKNSYLWKSYFIVLILFFVFTHYHPQWLLWVTPFFILELVKNNFRNILSILVIFGAFVGTLFFFDPTLSVTLFAPLFPGLYKLPGIWEILGIPVDYNLGRSLLQTTFSAASIYLIFYNLFDRENV